MRASDLNSRVLACLLMCPHTFTLAAYRHSESILISEFWLCVRVCLTTTWMALLNPQFPVGEVSFRVVVSRPRGRRRNGSVGRSYSSGWAAARSGSVHTQTRFCGSVTINRCVFSPRAKSSFAIGIFYEWSAEGYANEGDWERDGGWGVSDISYPVRLPSSVGSKHRDVATERTVSVKQSGLFSVLSEQIHKNKRCELAAVCVFGKGGTSGRVWVSKLRCNRPCSLSLSLSRFRSFQKMFPIHPRVFPSSSYSSSFSLAFSRLTHTTVGALEKSPLLHNCHCIASQHI